MWNMAVVKPVSFKDKEKELLDYIKDKDFTYYVKSLIREDIEKNKKGDNQKPKKRLEFDF